MSNTIPGMAFQGQVFSQDYVETADPPTPPTWSDVLGNDAVYEEEIESETIKLTQATVNLQGLSGNIHPDKAREFNSIIDVAGQLTLMNVSYHTLEIWLPRIMCARPAGDVFNPGTAKIEFGLMIDRGIVKTGGTSIFEYLGCRVQRAVLSGREGEPVKLVLDIIGKTGANSLTSSFSGGATGLPAVAGTNYIAVPAGNDGTPYFMWHSSLTMFGGANKVFNEFQLTIENILHTRRNNVQAVDDIHLAGQNITLSIGADWAVDYADNIHQGTDTTGTLLLDSGGNASSQFVFAHLTQRAEEDPVLPTVPNAIAYPLNLAAVRDGTTEALAITNENAA